MRVLSPITRISSREGRLLITSNHVSFSGASPWELPRKDVSGVNVSAGLVSADLLVITTSGQRHSVPGVLFRDVLVAIELLGYLGSPSSPSAARPLPLLSIPTNYMPGRLVITDQIVRLEGRTAWEVARADVRGVSIEPGALTARLFVHTRDCDERVLCADHLPFNGSLRAVQELGYIPRESTTPLPQPDLSFPPLPPLDVAQSPAPRPASRQTPRTVPLAQPHESGQLPTDRSSTPVTTLPPAPLSPVLTTAAQLMHDLRRWMAARLLITSRGITRARSSSYPRSVVARALTIAHRFPQAQRRFASHLRGVRGHILVASHPPFQWMVVRVRNLSALPARVPVLMQRSLPALARTPGRLFARAGSARNAKIPDETRLASREGGTAPLSRGITRHVTRRPLVSWADVTQTRLTRSAVALAHDSRRLVSTLSTLILAVLLCVGIIADHQPPTAAHGTLSRHAAQPSAVPHTSSPVIASSPATPTPPPILPPVFKVFAGSHDGSLYALRASDGALLWRYQTSGQIESAPTLADGIVYAGSDDQTVYALRGQDGTIVWRYRTGGKVGGSPAVANGVVYIGSSDGYLYALRASDGTLLWRYLTRNWIVGQPAVVNGVVYIGSYDDYLYALRASDGALLWRYRTGDAVVSSPTVAAGVVYVGSTDNSLYALRAGNGALLWHFQTSGSLLSSPTLANGIVYIGSLNGALYAFRAGDGTLLWRHTTGGPVHSSPVIAGGTLYVGSSDGYLYALRAGDGRLLWRFQTGGAVNTVPQVARGAVYVGSADHDVYALNASNGAVVWSFKSSDVVSPRLAVGV